MTALPPDRNSGGGPIRQAYLLDALSAVAETDLLVAGRLVDDVTRTAVASVVEVEGALPPEPGGRVGRRVRDLRYAVVEQAPFEVAQHRQVRAALAGPLAELGAAADLVCVEYAGLAPLIPRPRPGHWALTLPNLASGMALDRARLTSGRRRWLHERERANALRFERWAVGTYDTTIVVSPEDAAALPRPTLVVPNGVDTRRYDVTPLPTDPRVVFTGALHTYPNVDGIVWFASEIWPLVRASVPDAELEIVGARPPPAVTALARYPGIQVAADVPSTVPFLQRARVGVVPIRIGTGSRLKALEAMAAGRPVVGTTIGLGGLDVEPGRHAAAADDSAAFARALTDLLLHDDRAVRLARSGRELVESRYSWARIGKDFVDSLLTRAGLDGRLQPPSADR